MKVQSGELGATGKTRQTSSRRDALTLDEERAYQVLELVYNAYLKGTMLYGHTDKEVYAPQWRHIPVGMEQGSGEHQRYLFFLTATDRMGVSNEIHRGHRELWAKHPWMYTADVLGTRLERMVELVREYRIGLPEKTAQNWLAIAGTFFGTFDGNPAAMYAEASVDAILAMKRASHTRDTWRLPGFGPKILSLLALFYAELGVIAMPPDAFPVDVHVQRLAISTDIISGEGLFLDETIERMLRPLLCRMVSEKGWSAIDLSHAIWFLGNRLCTRCPRTKSAPLLCPVYDTCGGAISTGPYGRGKWDLSEPRYRRGGDMTLCLPHVSSEGDVPDANGQTSLW